MSSRLLKKAAHCVLSRPSHCDEPHTGKELFRLEGKDYVIKEADIVYFRFNV